MARQRLDDDVRVERRKTQNRDAAERCRKKKLAIIEKLKKKVEYYESLLDTQCAKCKSLRELSRNSFTRSTSVTDSECSLSSEDSPRCVIFRSSSIDEYIPQNTGWLVPLNEPVMYSRDEHVFAAPIAPPLKFNRQEPSRMCHLEALASPKDVASERYMQVNSTSIQYSSHQYNVPIVLRSPVDNPPFFQSLPSAGGLMIGGHPLRNLMNPNTGFTPFPGHQPQLTIILSPSAQSNSQKSRVNPNLTR